MRKLPRCSWLTAVCLSLALAPLYGVASTIAPLPPPPYAVGCSNVAQDLSRLSAGESATDYWEGIPSGSRERYVTQLLSEPADALTVGVTPPDDRELFNRRATQTIPYLVLVCYPTSSDNARPDYFLSNGRAVPRMQRSGEAPVWADAGTRYPVLLFSHGLTGSPLSNDYMDALSLLAGYGYVVIAPFHGDARFANLQIDDLVDLIFAALNIPSFTEMQAVRPLSLASALDLVLSHPHYRDHVDANRIGGFGGSLGGESLLLMAGAKLTTTLGQSSKQVMRDSRLKAIVGYVPYFGQTYLPAFGRDQNGLSGIDTPVLAIAGTLDTTSSVTVVAQGMRQLTGSRQLVILQGVEHGFDYVSAPDIFTWSINFLAAQALDDRRMRALVARTTNVQGGGDDSLVIDYISPAPPLTDEVVVTEFYNRQLDHYFLTGERDEAAMLAEGNLVSGWQATGFQFKVWSLSSGRGALACRFFGAPEIGPSSHFFTVDTDECAKVRNDPHWKFESFAFAAEPAINDACPDDRIPVIRLYNNGKGGQASHRYLTSRSETARMKAEGWIAEGAVFCGLP